MPIWIIVVLCLLLLLALSYFIYNYRRHTLGIDAPEKKLKYKYLINKVTVLLVRSLERKMKSIGFMFNH